MLTNKFEVKIVGNSIFRVEFLKGAEIELEDAELIFDFFLKQSQGKKYCVLLDARNQFTTSPESRAFVGSKERAEWKIAFAIVTKSIANRLVGNFFIQFNKPVSPTRLFSEESAAMQWLYDQKAAFESLNKKTNTVI